MSRTVFLPHDAATRSLGVYLGQHLPAGTILCLRGDLGSGKTTLVKGLGQGLGISAEIDSPTFTLVNEYLEGRLPLYHVDLYRLEGAAVADLALEVYWDARECIPGIVAIEWSERLVDAPPEPLIVTLTDQEPGRSAHLHPSTPAQATLLETLSPDAILAHEV